MAHLLDNDGAATHDRRGGGGDAELGGQRGADLGQQACAGRAGVRQVREVQAVADWSVRGMDGQASQRSRSRQCRSGGGISAR